MKKNIKNLFTTLLLMTAPVCGGLLTSCSDSNDAFFTAGEDDYPRILNTDIPEASGGNRAALPSITRDNNFKMDVIVTPAEYTTVTWFIDGQQVHEGKSIDHSLIAGTYDVDIVATTTKGLQTKRLCTLDVLALDTDPALAQDAKSLWCQIGTAKTIAVSNFDGVTTMYIAGQKINDFKNDGSSISFTVPALAEGEQKVVVETADGTKYGCGNVKISYEAYVDPGVQTVTLWEGSVDINWGDANVQLHDQLADVPVGSKIVLHYEMISADYHALRITNNDWSKDILPQVDAINDNYPNGYELEYTAEVKAIADESCMLITGFGYRLTSVTAEIGAPAEAVVWEGDVDINWGDSNVQLHDQLADVKVGSTIVLQYEMISADYHALRVTNNDWSKDILPQVDDINIKCPDSYEIEYTADVKAIVDESCMLITGFGYKLKKVIVK